MSRTVDDEIECLEARRKDTLGTVERLLDLQRSLARYLIGPHTDYVPDVQTPSNPFSNPRWLLRAFHGRLEPGERPGSALLSCSLSPRQLAI